MAAPNVIPRAGSHTRSISLPSRSHPLAVSVEEHLYRLKASVATSTSSSSSSICHKLSGLEDLYECVGDMLQLPLIQQALSHGRHENWVEDVLDGSLRVLDVCGTTRDVLSQMKVCVQDLESSLRRRRGGESGLANELGKYIISRKKVNKLVSKSFGNLKRMEKKHSSVVLDKDCDLTAISSILREVEEISLSVFESLLSSISRPKARTKPISSWSLVSKLMRSKRIACEGEEGDSNEDDKINVALNALNSQNPRKYINVEQVQNLMKPLEALDASIQELDDGLACAFRRIIQTRVSLLNILSH